MWDKTLLNAQLHVQDISMCTLIFGRGRSQTRIHESGQKIKDVLPAMWMPPPVCLCPCFAYLLSIHLPVIMSSCQTLPVIVKDPTSILNQCIWDEASARLLWDLLQLLFLPHAPSFFSKSNNTDAACILHTCFLFRPVALNALHGPYSYWCDAWELGHLFLCVLCL